MDRIRELTLGTPHIISFSAIVALLPIRKTSPAPQPPREVALEAPNCIPLHRAPFSAHPSRLPLPHRVGVQARHRQGRTHKNGRAMNDRGSRRLIIGEFGSQIKVSGICVGEGCLAEEGKRLGPR